MEWRYWTEIGANLARIERIADRTRRPGMLPRDARSDALARVVRERRGAAGQQIEPLGEERQLALPIVRGFRRPWRGCGMKAVPPVRKHVGSREERLPAIEFGPREIPPGGYGR
jgi:hypothetical protein